MQSLKRAVSQVVQRGRIGRTKSFVAAVIAGLLVLPAITAMAYYASTGTFTATAVAQSGTNPVTLVPGSPSYFSGPNTTGTSVLSLPLGGSVEYNVVATCATAPCTLSGSWTLNSWTADSGHSGCTSTAFPGQFVVGSPATPNSPQTVTTNGGTASALAVINMVNLASNQGPCSGATFTFNIATP